MRDKQPSPLVSAKSTQTPAAPAQTLAQPLSSGHDHQMQRLLNMQRTIGNQASLRLLRPASSPMPIRQRASKSYVKRAVIQRNIMPYDTWKDYSDGGLLNLRPAELKTVDMMMQTYKDLQPADQPASQRQMVVLLKKYRNDNGGAGSKEWKKNKRSEAVDTLIDQIEETQRMQGAGLETIQLWGVSEFTEKTKEIGKYFDAGLSGFQKEIIKRLTTFHELKDPTGADLNQGLALLYQMKEMVGYWNDQNGQNAKRTNRKIGMDAFVVQLDAAIVSVEKYMGGQIRGGVGKAQIDPATLSTVAGGVGVKSEMVQQEERITQLKIEHEGGAESLFKKLGALISAHPGSKTEINVEVKFPIQYGIFLGAHFKVTSETDIELSAKDGAKVKTPFTKIHSDLTATFGWEMPKIVELKAEIGGYLESRGETPKDAMLLLSYAFYRRLMDAKYGSSATRRVAGLIWGGYTGKSGVKMAELWGKKVEKSALDKDIAYAESGGTVIGGVKVGSKATVVDMGLKYQYFNGRKYTKKTVAAGNAAETFNKNKGPLDAAKEVRFDDDNQWHEVKFEVGLAGIFRAELKAKIPTRTAKQTKDGQKKQRDEAIKKVGEANTGLQAAQVKKGLAQTAYDIEVQAVNAAINLNDQNAISIAHENAKLAKIELDKAAKEVTWWEDYKKEQDKITAIDEKDQSLPLNLEIEAFTIFTVGAVGWGAVLEGLLAELGMKVVEFLRDKLGISEGRGTDLKPTPAEWLSHAAQFDKFNTPASYGVLGKDNIKTGSLTGETGSSPKDVATSQSGFSLTLSCKVKEGVATWLVSVERASEVGINVGVFKADMKQKRRIFGFTIKKLATGDKDLSGKRKDEVNFAMV